MLAEPRRREKYSINPRGLEWTNDDGKIGQKLLEKMGWKKGNSLGLRENGISDPINVVAKSNRQGVGCTKKDADNWIAHQDAFSSILASLNEEASQPTPESSKCGDFFSLEEKSKVSRSRVHYKKFAKGKDLSTYEAGDIQSIFGQRQKQVTSHTEEDSFQCTESTNGAKMSFGVVTVNSTTSMQNYFAQKMADIKQKLAKSNDSRAEENNELQSSSEVSSVLRKHHKRKQTSDMSDSAELDSKSYGHEVVERKKSKKHKKSDIVATQTVDCCAHELDLCGGPDALPVHVKKGKKKKKDKHFDVSEKLATSTAVHVLDQGNFGDKPSKKLKTKHVKTLDQDVVESNGELNCFVSESASNGQQNEADVDMCKTSKTKKSKKNKRHLQ